MFGKFFASTFTGSMFGAGSDVFAVWGYVIANTVDGRVELNPKLLASIIGSSVEAVDQAITELCEPDPLSRNGEAEGRRLQREGQYQYRVTSHEIYRALRNEEDRRAYNRKKKQESREKQAAAVKLDMRASNAMSTMSAHTEAEAETDLEAEKQKKKLQPPKNETTARSKRPIYTSDRFAVFEWQLDELSKMLGAHFDDFDLHAFFDSLSQQSRSSGLVIPKADVWAWLQGQVLAEAKRRGFPIASAVPVRDHDAETRAQADWILQQLNAEKGR